LLPIPQNFSLLEEEEHLKSDSGGYVEENGKVVKKMRVWSNIDLPEEHSTRKSKHSKASLEKFHSQPKEDENFLGDKVNQKHRHVTSLAFPFERDLL
jgi:hypothetical protein